MTDRQSGDKVDGLGDITEYLDTKRDRKKFKTLSELFPSSTEILVERKESISEYH